MKKQPLVKLTQKQLLESMDLYQRGVSLQQLGILYNVSRQAMWDLLRRRIKLRNNTRIGKDNHFYRGGIRAEDKIHNLFEEAIERGKIIPKNKCEKCGEQKIFRNGRRGIEAHHSDYNKPFDVMWLCRQCHYEWHKKNKAKRYENN